MQKSALDPGQQAGDTATLWEGAREKQSLVAMLIEKFQGRSGSDKAYPPLRRLRQQGGAFEASLDYIETMSQKKKLNIFLRPLSFLVSHTMVSVAWVIAPCATGTREPELPEPLDDILCSINCFYFLRKGSHCVAQAGFKVKQIFCLGSKVCRCVHVYMYACVHVWIHTHVYRWRPEVT